jgi:hypothetical protein
MIIVFFAAKPLDFYHTRGMQRTSQNLKEDVVKNDFGVRAQPLVSIEHDHIIIDELHLPLRICDKLLRNSILDTKMLDDSPIKQESHLPTLYIFQKYLQC